MPLKFTALNDELAGYVDRHHTNANDPLLAELQRETATLGEIAGMQISPEQGTFLGILVAAAGVRTALEIGTFTGYSSLCIARNLVAGGKLICCDQSAEWTDIARRFWQKAGVADRIDLRLGPAAETVGQLDPDLSFDFVFIDADKPAYDSYYEAVLPRVRPGGLLVFDNMLYHGTVVHDTGENPTAVRQLNTKLAADPRVESVLLPVADGIQLCRKL